MRRTGFVGLSLLLIAALAMPVFGQAAPAGQARQPQARTQPEYNAYLALYNEQAPQKKAELGEKFLTDFKDSDFVPNAYRMIIAAYTKTQTWPKVMDAADRAAAFPGADAALKGYAYGSAMLAAQNGNNFEKMVEYGKKVLGIDPNDPNALLTLSQMIPERLPTDEAGKKTALDEAAGYASKAQTVVQQIAGLNPQQKAELEGQIHSTFGFINLNRQDYPKAVSEYELALKNAPKDAVAHYRLGLAYQYLASSASKELIAAVQAENEAKKARADQPTLDELAAKSQGIQDDIRKKMDRSMEELATAVALGGVVGQPARDALTKLWQQKNDNTNGLEEFINSKKQ